MGRSSHYRPTPPDLVQFSASIERKTNEAIRQLAADEQRSISFIARKLFRSALKARHRKARKGITNGAREDQHESVQTS